MRNPARPPKRFRVLAPGSPQRVFGHATRAVIYARVSTREQRTLPDQVRALEEYCSARNWGVVQVVSEVGSGAAMRRGREQLLERARRRELDVVVVSRLDRWGRTTADLLATLEELTALEVGFVSLHEAIDLTTPTGRMFAALLAAFAQFERERTRERVVDGLEAARARGTVLGRPAVAAAQSAKVRKLARAGLKPGVIAKRVGISRTSVRRILAAAPAT